MNQLKYGLKCDAPWQAGFLSIASVVCHSGTCLVDSAAWGRAREPVCICRHMSLSTAPLVPFPLGFKIEIFCALLSSIVKCYNEPKRRENVL